MSILKLRFASGCDKVCEGEQSVVRLDTIDTRQRGRPLLPGHLRSVLVRADIATHASLHDTLTCQQSHSKAIV